MRVRTYIINFRVRWRYHENNEIFLLENDGISSERRCGSNGVLTLFSHTLSSNYYHNLYNIISSHTMIIISKIIRASLSKPHTSRVNGGSVYISRYIIP